MSNKITHPKRKKSKKTALFWKTKPMNQNTKKSSRKKRILKFLNSGNKNLKSPKQTVKINFTHSHSLTSIPTSKKNFSIT